MTTQQTGRPAPGPVTGHAVSRRPSRPPMEGYAARAPMN